MQRLNNVLRLSGGFIVLSALLLGCGKSGSVEYVVVDGDVSWQGKPISRGTIRFVPMGNTKGPASAAEIVDGRYVVESRGGVPVGEHRVEITAMHGGRSAAEENSTPADDGAGRSVQYIPLKYNKHSELKATVESGKERMTLDYDLQ
ncbi:MAG: hypothetical protein JXM70_11435 [Pirellulales bacterium]|nr:hypothetical protein [Pirellulales bacterium]